MQYPRFRELEVVPLNLGRARDLFYLFFFFYIIVGFYWGGLGGVGISYSAELRVYSGFYHVQGKVPNNPCSLYGLTGPHTRQCTDTEKHSKRKKDKLGACLSSLFVQLILFSFPVRFLFTL